AALAIKTSITPNRLNVYGACTRFVFLGLRGSGERARPEQENMGDAVYRTYQTFVEPARYGGAEVRPVGVDDSTYPASGVETLLVDRLLAGQDTSVQLGVAALNSHVLFDTPDACLLLVGYSQGAWVIDRFLRTDAGQNNLDRIAAVVLLGDPLYDSDSVGAGNAASVTDPGHSLTRTAARGVLPSYGFESSPFGSGLDGRVASFCHEGDPVCDFRGPTDGTTGRCLDLAGRTVFCSHLHYVPGFTRGLTDDAARFLLARVDAVQAAPNGRLPVVEPTSALTARGIDLTRWCSSVGGGDVAHPPAVVMTGAVAAWRCSDGRSVDWAAACDQQYGPGTSRPVMYDPDDAYTVKCQPT
ncbi:MAG: cutinase family protein, partial [Pseudonocardia sp.]|nr:cutinase family protein [Pseudonocardia sp.]